MRKGFSFVFVVLIAATGCQVEERRAPKDLIVAEPAEIFQMSSNLQSSSNNQLLTKNNFFLWKANLSTSQVKEVLRSARLYDEAVDKELEMKPKVAALEKELEAVLEKWKAAIDSLDSDAQNAFYDLDMLEQENYSKEDDTALSEQIKDADAKVKAASVSAEIADLERQRSDARKKWGIPYREKQKWSLKSEKFVAEIIANTDYFESMPDLVRLRFLSGNQVSVYIKDWPSKNTNHSTDDGTIRDVQWNGKELRFEVDTAREESYRFKIVRTRTWNKTRIAYQGEMNRWRYGKLDRRGVAKLATETVAEE